MRYHEPHIGIAAVKVLEALGFEVSLVKNRRCCGRPAFSQGNLGAAAKLANHNVKILSSLQNYLGRPSLGERGNTPILFLEPSCWSMFVEDYRELKIENAEKIANALFFVRAIRGRLAGATTGGGSFQRAQSKIADSSALPCQIDLESGIHGKIGRTFARNEKRTVLDTACCGMAGAFGALAEKYDLSIQVAQDLIDKIDNQPAGTEIIASGTSCRHQITDLTNARPKHMAEFLADALL